VFRLFGIFIIFHGLVHLLYFGQSARYFELQPGLTWPDGAWAFTKLLGGDAIRKLAGGFLILAAISLAIGGVGIVVDQAWARLVVIAATAFSGVIFILFWDGVAQHLDGKGAIGILINLAILAAILVFKWPSVG